LHPQNLLQSQIISEQRDAFRLVRDDETAKNYKEMAENVRDLSVGSIAVMKDEIKLGVSAIVLGVVLAIIGTLIANYLFSGKIHI